MEEDVPAAAIAAVAAAARALMRNTGEEGLVDGLSLTAIRTAERFCGIAWADGVPAPVAQGAAMLVQHLFEDRGGDRVPPAAVAALWRPYRRVRL